MCDECEMVRGLDDGSPVKPLWLIEHPLSDDDTCEDVECALCAARCEVRFGEEWRDLLRDFPHAQGCPVRGPHAIGDIPPHRSLTGGYWRVPTGFNVHDYSATDVLAHERDLGNYMPYPTDLLEDVFARLPATRLRWACKTKAVARRYAYPQRTATFEWVVGAPILHDGDGGYLILVCRATVPRTQATRLVWEYKSERALPYNDSSHTFC